MNLCLMFTEVHGKGFMTQSQCLFQSMGIRESSNLTILSGSGFAKSVEYWGYI